MVVWRGVERFAELEQQRILLGKVRWGSVWSGEPALRVQGIGGEDAADLGSF